jgi:S1-C subfamily serine protease
MERGVVLSGFLLIALLAGIFILYDGLATTNDTLAAVSQELEETRLRLAATIDVSGHGYVQTDVPINTGSSGGALLEADGDIVGINTWKVADAEGLGFAIPVEVAWDFTAQALNSLVADYRYEV